MLLKQILPRTGLHLALISLITAILCVMGSFASASVPSPRVKPDAPNSSQFLSRKDAKLLRLGMSAADRRAWRDVARYQNDLSDPIAKNILLWRRAVSNANMSWDEYEYVITQMSDWPRMVRIKSSAEKLLFEKPVNAQRVLSFFTQSPPVSGEGRAALARAHYSLGNQSSGDEWLKLAWRESKLTRDRQRELFGQYKSRLNPQDHAARADHLVWLGKRYYSSAEALMPHMPSRERADINARIRVGANRSGMDAAIKALRGDQKTATGILYERAYWRRKRKSKDYALPVYLDMHSPASTEAGRSRLWTEKKIMAYWLIDERKYQDAYRVVQNHGLTRGEGFASAEFLAGWLALQHLGDAQSAQTHFTRLRQGVSMPVSVSRAAYWQGRASESLSDGQHISHYADAAQHINTYYGQLASERLSQGGTYISMPPEAEPAERAGLLEGQDVIRALRLIGETGNERVYRQFSFHIDDIVEDARDLSYLGKIARDYGLSAPSVRAGKQAGRFNAILTDTSYPVPAVITELGSGFDIPFVLAIARQESEFMVNATSHANAYGMMQMINSTAKATARKHRLRYSRSWLNTDQSYAVKLGALHLNDLLERYDGSYIMTAAAYNAGPHRVTQWVRAYGDPRTGEIDPIDWVESLPFSETRNYVMRVMENLHVYRARTNNDQARLTPSADLRRGG